MAARGGVALGNVHPCIGAATCPRKLKSRSWNDVLSAYAQPRLGRSLADIGTSIVPYLALSVVMYKLLAVSVV